MTDKKQEEMKQQIASYLSKKEYYEILGLQKSATDVDIKKAYRALALRFHPDKNSTQGAKQVFKKVSHAYSVLIDPEQKNHYDQFGPEQERPRPQNRGGNSQEDYQYGEYDDIFRAFFGGVPVHHMNGRAGRTFRTHTYSFGGNNRQGQEERQGGFNFYYIFVILFVIYTFAPLFQSAPSFSTIPSNQHKYKLKTSLLQTEFYATQQYFEEIKSLDFKRQSEMLVDRQAITQLESKCQGKKRQKKRLQEMAYKQHPGARRQSFLTQAKNVDTSPCRRISDFRHQHEDYIRDLTYMR